MGLDKAKEMMSQDDEEDKDQGPKDESDSDSSDDESDDSDDKGSPSAEKMISDEIDHEAGEGALSDDEIDELISLLQSKKAKKE